jgi:uncharacterized membrane protein
LIKNDSNGFRVSCLPVANLSCSICATRRQPHYKFRKIERGKQMSNQPPYGNPPGGYPPPGGGYPGGGYPPPQGGYPPPGGGYPPPGGGGYGYGGPPPENKTKTFGLNYNVAALLCYLPICCINLITSIIWLVTEPKENKFLRFHALQSLFLTGVGIVVWVLFVILAIVFGVGAAATSSAGADVAASGLMAILQIIQWIIWAGLLVVHIICMVKANQMQMWKLPVIGNLAEKNA